MGFFDEYKEISGDFISGDEKIALAEAGIPLVVQGVREDFKYDKDRYVLTVTVPNPETGDEEERLLAFDRGTVDSRDRMIAAMAEYLETEGAETPSVKLEKVGRSWILRDAEAAA